MNLRAEVMGRRRRRQVRFSEPLDLTGCESMGDCWPSCTLIGPALWLPKGLDRPELRASLHETLMSYSLYKHGSYSAMQWMAVQMLRLLAPMRERIAACRSTSCIVVSPPYSTIPSSATYLAMLVARELHVPHVALRSSRVPLSARYTCLSDRRDRLSARKQCVMSVPPVIRGKHILIVDDALTTGATASWLVQRLGVAASVSMCYAIDLRDCDPAFEAFVDAFLVHSRSWQVLNRVLSSSTTAWTRTVLRTFFWQHEGGFRDLLAKVSRKALQRLHVVAVSAYGRGEYAEQVSALEAVLAGQ